MYSTVTIPATRIPCIYPFVTERGIGSIVSTWSYAQDAAIAVFIRMLRTVVGTSGEMSFRCSEKIYVVAELENDIENWTIVDGSGGLRSVEARLCFGMENHTLDQDILFSLNVLDYHAELLYSKAHIPADFASRLLPSNNLLSILNCPQTLTHLQSYLLHSGFVENSQKNPSKVAVDCLGADSIHRTLTYSEVNCASSSLAHRLNFGIERVIIPIFIPPSPEIYVAYLAILRAGHAFCPLPSLDDAPVERIMELINDVNARVVLGFGPRPAFLVGAVEWVDVNKVVNEQSESHIELNVDIKPDDLAYVLFTSGSTGKPKGVEITHRAASSSIRGHLSVLGGGCLPEWTRWFQFAASTFDPSIMEIFTTLYSGGILCCAPRTIFLSDPEGTLRSLKCTHMMATPSMAELLRVEDIIGEDSNGKGFELWTMGEKLSDVVIRNFTRPEIGVRLFNAYGPTEAAINVTLRAHPRNQTGARLGPPIPTAGMVILHPTEAKIVPMGCVGELGLVGAQLARGYLNNPTQTAQVFVHVEQEGVGRVYRTGDKARAVVDEKGRWSEVEYLGRIGMGQVKIMGRRVELGEIESIISSTINVQAAYCVLLPGTDQLYAVITTLQSGDAFPQTVEELKIQASKHLPVYMRPLGYFPAPGNIIPRTSAGKADRKAIAKIVEKGLEDVEETGEFEGTKEEQDILDKIMSAVRETVGDRSRVTSNSSLFALGIDSLRGVRFLKAIKATLGKVSIGMRDILGEDATPGVLTRLITSQETNCEPIVDVGKLKADFATSVQRQLLTSSTTIEKILPSTPMQTSLLALYLRHEGGQGYINNSVYTLSSGIDLPRFKRAWEALVARDHNRVLRTGFVLVEDEAAQDVSAFAQVVYMERPVVWEETEDDLLSYLDRVPLLMRLDRRMSVVGIVHDGSALKWVLSLHHSIFDGASLALMLEELVAVYYGYDNALIRHDIEFSVNDALIGKSKKYEEEAGKYWGHVLKDFEPTPFPDLTGLRTNAKAPGHHVSEIISQVPWSMLKNTNALATVQAAWGLLLYAYCPSEEKDIVFGSVISGRVGDEQLEGVVGPVFTTVPIRLQNIQGSAADVVNTLAKANGGAHRWRYVPIRFLTDGKGGGIVYDTTIALQWFPEQENHGEDDEKLWTSVQYPEMITEFAVVLEIWPEDNDSIRLRATCKNDVLTSNGSDAMLYQLDDILAALLAHSGKENGFVELLDFIRPSLKAAANTSPTKASVPPGCLLHHEFERNFRTRPDRLALWFKHSIDGNDDDTKYTYATLDVKANQLAHYLIRKLGSPGLADTAIPICLEKSVEMYVAILGVLKAGAAWCPIDPEAPLKRRTDLIKRACEGSALKKPVVLVRDQTMFDETDEIVVIDLGNSEISLQSTDKPEIHTKENDLAYLIWTSGTTGLPKGVPIEHRAAVQSLSVLQEVIPWKEDEDVRCLNFSAYTFDVSVLDIFYPLSRSCGAICASQKENLVRRFDEVIKAFGDGITHAFLTPAFMSQFTLSQHCPSLRALISIGEKLPDGVADSWSLPEQDGGVVALNTYGPAESTIIATYRRFFKGESVKAHNVGVPISTVSTYALSPSLRILPRGAVGELALGGYQNARGYHRNPEMTAKKFVTLPNSNEGVYTTGDIVRFLYDGSVEFVGRNDDLIKLGGIRVELSEISAYLRDSSDLVQDVTTLMLSRRDRPTKVICTFFSAPSLVNELGKPALMSEAAVNLAKQVHEKGKEQLPVFMRPNVVLILQRLPITASNKIDRKALQEVYETVDIAKWETLTLFSENDGESQTDDGVFNETELAIQRIVSELTGVPIAGVRKDTVWGALGVDSIRALQLTSRLRKAGLNVSVGDIVRLPTIRSLGQFILQQEQESPTSITTEDNLFSEFSSRWKGYLNDMKVQTVLPCTPVQEGMLAESFKDTASYWSHRLFSLPSNIDLVKLEDAWNKVTRTCEALRVIFVVRASQAEESVDSTDNVFVQAILESDSTPIVYRYIEDDEDYAAAAARIAKNTLSYQLPPWGVTIFKSKRSTRMMLSMHHTLYDGDAVPYLLCDVHTAYEGGIVKRTQFGQAMSLALRGVGQQSATRWWSDVLQDYSDSKSLDLHVDLPPDTQGAGFWLSKFTTSVADMTGRGYSMGTILQAVWGIVFASRIHDASGDIPGVVFGETLSVRMMDRRLEDAIAPLMTTLPVIVPLKMSTGRELLEEMSKFKQQRQEHGMWVSFQTVRKALKRKAGEDLFQTVFVIYSEEGDHVKDLGSIDRSFWGEPEEVSALSVEHSVAINVTIRRSGEVEVAIHGAKRAFSVEQVDLLAQQYEGVLKAILFNMERPIGEMLSSLDEKSLSITHPTPIPSSPSSVVEWLIRYAKETPDAIAVADDTWSWTYNYMELDKKSNQIARWISAKQSDGIVALCIPRTSKLFVAYLFGILKSNNTYLPIAHTLPSFRKRLIVRQNSKTERLLILTTDKLIHDFTSLDSSLVVTIDSKFHIDEVDTLSSEYHYIFDTRSKRAVAIVYVKSQRSTSSPVRLQMKGIVHVLQDIQERIRISTASPIRWANWIGLAHDMHLFETLIPISAGATIVLTEPSKSFKGLTHAILSPPMIQTNTALRCVITFPGCLAVGDIPEDMSLYSAYGSAELSGIASIGLHCRTSPDIGKPLSCLTAIVMREGRICLRGEIGELYLSGDPVVGGAAKIVQTPHGPLMKTGMLVKIAIDGTLIPIVGMSNVDESSDYDISTLTLEHPEGTRPYTVKFISKKNSFDPLDGSIPTVEIGTLSNVDSSLYANADFVLPLTFIPISSSSSRSADEDCLMRLFAQFPLNILKSQNQHLHAYRPTHQQPLSETELKIRSVLSRLSGVPTEAITGETTTVEIGVDSLSAIKLSWMLKAVNLYVEPREVLGGVSLRYLAKKARTAERSRAKTAVVVDAKVKAVYPSSDVASIVPCLPLQEGLIAHTVNSITPVYCNHFVMHLKESTDVQKLRDAVDGTIQANEILRTCFAVGDDRIWQVVLKYVNLDNIWRYVEAQDALAASKGDMDNVAKSVVEGISQVPPLRFGIYQDAGGQRYMCLTAHHAIYDGESLPMILSEICQRYQGTFSIKRMPMTGLLEYISIQSMDDAKSFFMNYLRNASLSSTPVDIQSKSQHHSYSSSKSLSLFEQTARSLNIGLPVLALAAYGVALAEIKKTDDVVFGTVLSGRTVLVEGIEDVMAPCITTMPVRICGQSPISFADFASNVLSDYTNILEHQYTPLRMIQKWLDSGHLFDSLFSFNRTSTGSNSELWESSESQAELDYPLAVAVDADISSDQLSIRVGHYSSFISAASAEVIISRIEQLLSNPQQIIALQPSLASSRSTSQLPNYGEEWSSTELLIRDAIAELCRVESGLITKDVSFIHLGIDSITSIRLAQHLRAHELQVPTHAIMQHSCVGALAAFISSYSTTATRDSVTEEFNILQNTLRQSLGESIKLLAENDEIQSVFPATPLQMGMLSQSISSRGKLYLIQHTLKLAPGISISGLKEAWKAVIQTTDILRSTFHPNEDGRYPWVVAVHRHVPMSWHDHTVESDDQLDSVLLHIRDSFVVQDERAFQTQPPILFHLVQSPSVDVLVVIMHHCLYDGMSIPYILDDVATAYHDVNALSRHPQFTEVVPFILHSALSSETSGFWKSLLGSYVPALIPQSTISDNASHHAKVVVDLPGNFATTLKDLDITPHAILLLAWGKTLATLVGSLDVVFGQVVAGRSIDFEDALNVRGPMFNTIPFRFAITDPTWSNKEAAQAQHSANVASESHQHVSLRTILKDWRQNGSQGPLFDSLFVFQYVQERKSSRAELWSGYENPDETSSAQYPLSVEVVFGTGLEIRAGCRSDTLSLENLHAALDIMSAAVLDIINHPDENVLHYPPALGDIRPSESRVFKPPVLRDPSSGEHRELKGFEPILRNIFASVAQIPPEQIDITVPLYAFGLDSVAAIQIAAKCRATTGLQQLSVTDIFEGETIEGICALYESRVSDTVLVETDQHLVPTTRKMAALASLHLSDDSVQYVLPILAGQQYHLAAWLMSEKTFFQPVFVYKPTQSLDVTRLENAWQDLQARHDILRTVFAAVDKDIVQVVLKMESCPKSFEVLQYADGDFREIVKSRVRSEYRNPSNMYSPPVRLTHVKVGDEEAVLMVMHHAVYDAWSIPMFVSDLSALYRGEECKTSSDLVGFVNQICRARPTEEQTLTCNYWKTSLLGGDYPLLQPTNSSVNPRSQVFSHLPGLIPSVASIQDKCRTEGVNLQAVLLAVIGKHIKSAMHTESDPVIGLYHTGRAAAYPSIDKLAIPLVNVLPMRIPISEDGEIMFVARHLQSEMGRRVAFEHCSVAEISEYLGKNAPLFNVFVNIMWHSEMIKSIKGAGVLLESFSVGPPTDYIQLDKTVVIETPVDDMETGFVSKMGLYLDIVLNSQTDSIGIAARCHEVLLGKEELDRILEAFGKDVITIMNRE